MVNFGQSRLRADRDIGRLRRTGKTAQQQFKHAGRSNLQFDCHCETNRTLRRRRADSRVGLVLSKITPGARVRYKRFDEASTGRRR